METKKAELEQKAAEWLKDKGYDRRTWKDVSSIIAAFVLEQETTSQQQTLNELEKRITEAQQKYDENGYGLPLDITLQRTFNHIDASFKSKQYTIERLMEHLKNLYGRYADDFFGSMKHPIDTEHCKAAFKAKIKLIQKDLEQLLNTTEPIETFKAKGE